MKHPMGMYVISVTEMWERFSFYIFSGILVLFMLEVLCFSMEFATCLFGIIIASTYFLQLIAGYITDTYIGNRKAIIFGGILMLISQIVFTYDASLYYLTANVAEHSAFLFSYPEIVFLIGVVIMAVGASFFKVSVTSFVGLFYPDNEELLDSAYTVFYMLINVGGFLAPLALNFAVGVNDPSLYQYGFLIGAITIFIGLVMFIVLKNKYLRLPNGEPIGVIPICKSPHVLENKSNGNIADKLSKIEIDRLKVIFLILIMITVFFIAHEQISTSLIILPMTYINNVIPFTGIEVAPQFFLTLNPLFIIILSPVFVKLFSMLSDRKKEPSSISKLGIGLFLVAVSYVFLYIPLVGIQEYSTMHMSWMFAFNFILVVAELLMMPIALSLISKLAPLKYRSLMVGVLFVASAVANVISGYFASAFPDEIGETTMLLGLIPLHGPASFMVVFIVLSVVFALMWLLLKNKIKKLMHGIN